MHPKLTSLHNIRWWFLFSYRSYPKFVQYDPRNIVQVEYVLEVVFFQVCRYASWVEVTNHQWPWINPVKNWVKNGQTLFSDNRILMMMMMMMMMMMILVDDDFGRWRWRWRLRVMILIALLNIVDEFLKHRCLPRWENLLVSVVDHVPLTVELEELDEAWLRACCFSFCVQKCDLIKAQLRNCFLFWYVLI